MKKSNNSSNTKICNTDQKTKKFIHKIPLENKKDLIYSNQYLMTNFDNYDFANDLSPKDNFHNGNLQYIKSPYELPNRNKVANDFKCKI